MNEGPHGELGRNMCRYTEVYDSMACSGHLDDWGETDSWSEAIQKKIPFYLCHISGKVKFL